VLVAGTHSGVVASHCALRANARANGTVKKGASGQFTGCDLQDSGSHEALAASKQCRMAKALHCSLSPKDRCNLPGGGAGGQAQLNGSGCAVM
jgi:hypothetical protein